MKPKAVKSPDLEEVKKINRQNNAALRKANAEIKQRLRGK